MKNFVRCFDHDKFLLVIEGFDHLKDSSGTSKVVKSHELLFHEHGYDYVCIYPINLTYRIGITMTGVYGLSVNGKAEGFTGLDNLKFCLAECERAGHGLAGILIHHAIFNDLEKLGAFLHAFLETKKVFYLHDYWTCCISINMMRDKAKNAWCHSDMKAGCNGCVWKERNDQHREEIKRFFDLIGVCEFIAPSESVKREWRLRNPLGFDLVRVIEHLKPSSVGVRSQESSADVVRVAFVGAPNINKGWLEFEYLAKRCKGKVKLYHMGHTDLRIQGVENVDVQIHKQGLNAMVNALNSNNIDISLLLSGWLETYSYTLFESLQAKSLVCCFEDSGNVADVIRKTGGGWCFKNKEALLDFLNSESLPAQVREKQRIVCFPQAMVTNDEVVSCFAGTPSSVGGAVLSARYSVLEDVKTWLIVASIRCFNRFKAVMKAVLKVRS